MCLTLMSCQEDDKDNIDLDNIKDVNVEIKRFDRALFALDTTEADLSLEAQIEQLEETYPAFFEVYQELITEQAELDTSITNRVRKFLSYKSAQVIYDTVQVVFDNLQPYEQELNDAFKRLKYYFPTQTVPEVVAYVSDYSTGVFTYGEEVLGIGLDFFHGKEDLYSTEIFPKFIQSSMNEQFLVAKAVEAVCTNIAGEVKGERLLDYMIANGKTLLLKSKLLPKATDATLMEWDEEEVAWMQNSDNQKILWDQIQKRDLLYSNRRTNFDKLIGPSPSGATWMPPESPGKAANWLGWKILEAYMKRHPEQNLSEVIQIEDPQLILNESRYRPGKVK